MIVKKPPKFPERKKNQKHRLSNIECSEVAIVDRGAIGVPFCIFKRDRGFVPSGPDPLSVLSAVDKGISALRRTNEQDYYVWKQHPEWFDYEFLPSEENPQNCIVKRKLATKPPSPLAETGTHVHKILEDGRGVWVPKPIRLNLNKGR